MLSIQMSNNLVKMITKIVLLLSYYKTILHYICHNTFIVIYDAFIAAGKMIFLFNTFVFR